MPAGLGIAALAAGMLMLEVPVVVAAVAVTLLSLGYDMTQPLLAGIVTALGGTRGALAIFSAVQLGAAVAAIPGFRSEYRQAPVT